jgi:hypothetical protein
MPVDGAPSFTPMDGSSSGNAPWWQQLLNVGGQIATDVWGPSYPTGGTYYPPYTPPFSGGGTLPGYSIPGSTWIAGTGFTPTSGAMLLVGAAVLLLFLRKR